MVPASQRSLFWQLVCREPGKHTEDLECVLTQLTFACTTAPSSPPGVLPPGPQLSASFTTALCQGSTENSNLQSPYSSLLPLHDLFLKISQFLSFSQSFRPPLMNNRVKKILLALLTRPRRSLNTSPIFQMLREGGKATALWIIHFPDNPEDGNVWDFFSYFITILKATTSKASLHFFFLM